MCLYAVKQVSAQVAEPAATAVADIEPLQIGDTLPDILWNLPLQVANDPNDERKSINLREFKGKFIILDFWATWCTVCHERFPKLDSLSHQFENLQVMLLNDRPSTRDSLENVRKFIGKWAAKFGEPFPMLSAIDTGTFAGFFRHVYLPHYVWIDEMGIVRAITSSKYVNADNIEGMLSDQLFELPYKDDNKRINGIN